MDKKNMRSLTVGGTAAVLFLLSLIIYPSEASRGAAEGISACVNLLIPSLFPFLAASEMLIRVGLAEQAGKLFEKPMRVLFGLPGACGTAFVLGACGGYAVGARAAVSLMEKGVIDRDQCQRLLSFCCNSGPAFIFGALGGAVFKSARAGALLFFCHIISAPAAGIFFSRSRTETERAEAPETAPIPFTRALTGSVKSAGKAMASICLFVIFFGAFTGVLTACGVIPAVTRALESVLSAAGSDPAYAQAIVHGTVELTAGVSSLEGSAPCPAALACSSFILGWGGLSVLMQVGDIVTSAGLKQGPVIKAKLFHGVLAALIAAAASAHTAVLPILLFAALSTCAAAVFSAKGLKKTKKSL